MRRLDTMMFYVCHGTLSQYRWSCCRAFEYKRSRACIYHQYPCRGAGEQGRGGWAIRFSPRQVLPPVLPPDGNRSAFNRPAGRPVAPPSIFRPPPPAARDSRRRPVPRRWWWWWRRRRRRRRRRQRREGVAERVVCGQRRGGDALHRA